MVIGAGPSGLAVAAMLRRADVPAVVLERSGGVGTSWSERYDHLELHTTRGFSRLPGLRVPRQAGLWVGRDDWVRYLERYAAHHRIDVRVRTAVRRIEPAAALPDRRTAARWLVHTADRTLPARAVVVATGRNHVPLLPDWPGRDTFTGELLHSRDYRNPGPYQGREVLVVGAGNSGAEIAVALAGAGAAKVWISVRTPPHIMPRSSNRWQAAGIVAARMPTAWGDWATALMQRLALPDLTPYGLPRPTTGMFTRAAREEVNPVLDHGFVDAIRARRVLPTAAVTGMDGSRVLLADGTSRTPDAVIAATGYRSDLERLLGPLPLLGANGLPVVRGARTSPHAPQLYFAGYHNPLTGALREIGIEGRRIARAIRRAADPTLVPAPRGTEAEAEEGAREPG
ncbi:putative oxidoreductase [Streptomyces sp. NBRC 110611]|uniref:flavin-containing monooxygenase n=1 Tax=Streptomyces sp. NBRC 110611 TaxID=1621259 RepID=UPI0008590CD1|nr:NAD(P)/FAD-dependent oxidoreductase [Streptomyces sp. NBRC 110611]GAU71203.1 putative oxidoreductase [Streptomyces sp. NBRC 110611]